MAKKKSTKNGSNDNHYHHPTKHHNHPVFRQRLTLGQKAADGVAKFGGSWKFIGLFALYLIIWMGMNAWLLTKSPFDPFPFILLNLTLSCLAAIQAPVILMTQNRQAERDRIDAKYDHAVNRKAEREIRIIQKDMDKITRHILELKRKTIK
ncbi:DUF1003 domain-containing protein [Candidatus Woesearchaeota archaeon]|jgi:uncharacterized membrane protein|nr:DUF1003 domain-containing protein [Candidatus Woesearchaeota archaeon]MBT5396954.1 DUF1003 domain-containing protein [Candidatus Woesearchaeota archaeon]MBT5924484.1 DUF1003 domain-containing protein [Candidatus Woesearchaeota archaeon]MBT6367147.1 DUF1003 domain-containing protein [Candidatus Woesearchaeota archaeon]MBT7762279.1 DUF1003 domain-containing protein [Candidatus Woesearchaeota archaeon]